MSTQATLVQISDADLVCLRGLALNGSAPSEPGERFAAMLASDAPSTYALEGALAGVHHLLVGDGVGLLGFLMDASVGELIASPLPEVRARVLAAPTVAAIADAIESMSAKTVRLRLDNAALSALEPFAGRALDDEDKEWLLAVLQGLMVFMRQAANERACLLVALH